MPRSVRSVVVHGRVTTAADDGSMVGVAGVAVSDGLHITRTDAHGSYELEIDPGRRATMLVFLTVPTGWKAPTDGHQRPSFYRRVENGGREVGRADFVLERDAASERSAYRFAALADVHVQRGAANHRERFGAQLEELGQLHADAHPDHELAFIVVAGDLTNDATAQEFDDYLTGLRSSPAPTWSAVGNHDLAGRVPGGPHPKPPSSMSYRERVDPYRRVLGPEWYSFQYGAHHFVVLENFAGLEQSDQLAWLARDLELHGAGKRIVVISHVPWNTPTTPSDDSTAPYVQLLARHDVQLLLAGHTHANDVAEDVLEGALHVVTTSAASTLDQTPPGYRIVDLSGERCEVPYGEFDVSRDMTVVQPVERVPVGARTVHVRRYRAPFANAEVQARIAPHDWGPLTAHGSRAWIGDIGYGATAPGDERRIEVRARDTAADPWDELAATFEVADDVAVPRQGRPWPMFHGNARHSGHAPESVAPPLDLAWSRHSGGSILTSSPAVGNGAVYIGVRDEDGAGAAGVLALDLATGALRWRAPTEGAVEASVAIHEDLVVAPAVRGPLRAFDASTGGERWRFDPTVGSGWCYLYFSPAVAQGLVFQAYTVAEGTSVVALDARTGEVRWRTAAPIGRHYIAHGSPAVDGDRLVFVTPYGNVIAIDARDGSLRWQTSMGGWTRSMPVIAGDVVLYNAQSDRLNAIDLETGQVRWCSAPAGPSLLHGEATAATPAVAEDIVYAAFSDGSVVALTLDTGERVWQEHLGAAVISSPAVCDDLVYVGANDGRLHALDRAGGRSRWSRALGSWVASSPVVTGNCVVAATWDGTIHAFTERSR